MPRLVCLLRGVNVGGKNRLAMAELRALLESLGYGDVRTFIQSGNVVFSTADAVAAADLERAIEARFGLAVAVALRSASELERAVSANPFPELELSSLHLAFLTALPSPDAVAGLDHARFLPEQFVLSGQELYLHLPAGMARTKLPGYLDRALGVAMTLRNWNTVTKLLELATA